MKKSNARRKAMGQRKKDADGFTLPYGCVQDGSKHKSGNRASVKRDKRAIKKKINREEENEN